MPDPFDDVDIDADLGPMVNAIFMYRLNEYIKFGPMVEYEWHPIEDEGDIYTLSILAGTEIGPGRMGNLDPYATLGIGLNANKASPDDVRGSDTDATFGFRLGAGTDFYITDMFALNTEFAWKYNEGEKSGNDYDFSSISFIFGGRLAF